MRRDPKNLLSLLAGLLAACGQAGEGPRPDAASPSAAGGASTGGGTGGRAAPNGGATLTEAGSFAASGLANAATGGRRTTGGTTGTAGAAPGGTTSSGGAAGSSAGGGGSGGGAGAPSSGGIAGSGGATNGAGGGPVLGGAGSGATAGGSPTESVTVWLAGDSTMANGQTPCPVGWGKAFKPYFNDRVTVTNSAVGGRSIHTWLYNVQKEMDSNGECLLARDSDGEPTLQARWTQMLEGMKAGDYLFVQFGINDGDRTCDRHVGIDAFVESLGTMAAAAKQRGARPIFLTPVSAVACNGNTPRGTRGGYVDATLTAGTRFDVPVIDLHAASIELYARLGFCPIPGGDVSATTGGPVGEFFCDDHTHFDGGGAREIAGLVAQALRDQGIALAGYLK